MQHVSLPLHKPIPLPPAERQGIGAFTFASERCQLVDSVLERTLLGFNHRYFVPQDYLYNLYAVVIGRLHFPFM